MPRSRYDELLEALDGVASLIQFLDALLHDGQVVAQVVGDTGVEGCAVIGETGHDLRHDRQRQPTFQQHSDASHGLDRILTKGSVPGAGSPKRIIPHGMLWAMTSRDQWLDEGLTVLREQGIAGVRVDRIASRLGLTKGSFHHHFDGVGDYRRSLLQRYELGVTAIIDHAKSAVRNLPPEQALAELPAHFPFDPRLEAAIRGWAFQEEEARETLQRVDTARLWGLTELWQAVVRDSHQARVAALIPYLVIIGASVSLPTLDERDMAEVFELLGRLVPQVK